MSASISKSFRLIVGFGALLSMTGIPAHAESVTIADNQRDHIGPVPAGAQIILETSRTSYFLGENIIIQFGIKNNSDNPFNISAGGDYRGASRALRFAVSAVASDGKEAADPDPSGFYMGGMGAGGEIKPGSTYWLHVPLIRYARLEHPGEYTITIRHDLGWQNTPARNVPIGAIKLKFKMPKANEAQAVVDAMTKLTDESWTYGEKGGDRADFTACRYPVYLPILVGSSESGELRAIEGIGAIETHAATDALVKLLDAKIDSVALAAAQILTMRMPDPDFDPKNPQRGAPFLDHRLAPRRALSAATWKPKHADKIRAIANGYLKADRQRVGIGAFMLECLGARDDLPAVITALDRVAKSSKGRTFKEDDFPRGPENSSALERAVTVILRRGGRVFEIPKTPGEQVAFAVAYKADLAFRPKTWQENLAVMLSSDIPYVQQAALEKMPASIPTLAPAQLAGLINSPDLAVQYYAVELAGTTKDGRYKDAIFNVLRHVKGRWLLNSADNAAAHFGLHEERYAIWIDRLDEPGLASEAMQRLAGLIDAFRGGGSFGPPTPDEAKRVKHLWATFLAGHRAEIQQGKRFPVGAITEDMIPVPMTLSLHGHPDGWPKRKAQ